MSNSVAIRVRLYDLLAKNDTAGMTELFSQHPEAWTMYRNLSPVAKGGALPPADDGRMTVIKSAVDVEVEQQCAALGGPTPENYAQVFKNNPALYDRYRAQFRR